MVIPAVDNRSMLGCILFQPVDSWSIQNGLAMLNHGLLTQLTLPLSNRCRRATFAALQCFYSLLPCEGFLEEEEEEEEEERLVAAATAAPLDQKMDL